MLQATSEKVGSEVILILHMEKLRPRVVKEPEEEAGVQPRTAGCRSHELPLKHPGTCPTPGSEDNPQ
jgi:hypothetical protein